MDIEGVITLLRVVPISFADACGFVREHHRHHVPPQGHKFSIAAFTDKIVGVAIVGRPVSRHLDDKKTLEVTRLATDGTKNACSFLYRAAWRATCALGYGKLITYTLATETGSSLRASGFKCLGKRGGGSWSVPSRPRIDKHPTVDKTLWQLELPTFVEGGV